MQIQKRADLHVHTDLSDGTFSPQKVVEYASQIGLDCIAICDHDVVDGIGPAQEAAKKYGIEIIPGVELTAEKQGHEIHILGFYIDYNDRRFRQKLEHICQQRIKRIYEMVGKLKKFGVILDAQDVLKLGGEGSVGRLHLARVMHEKGYANSVEEAFRKFIGDGKPCYVSKINLTPEEAIGEIVKVNGIPVLAHPGITKKDEFISSYVKYGLKGIEVYHTDHPPAMARHYEQLANDYGLLITGGSDCHGLGKGRVLMGLVTVPYELVEKLKNYAR